MDSMDMAQEREAFIRETQIKQARQQSGCTVSAFVCESCDAPIPEARRVAVPGVRLCVYCQGDAELKNKHYRGAL
ncbi:TraR/DksA family transcriptional regulator [Dickeya dadantii]|uniref:TraR/DksA family transcriptional regulator n=1 Tax=Dickeya dadantii TaxID=204038 RepID=UPI001C0AF672|nr:TraR/DksA family transcriptional regulator [Dickeya dadantii]QWT42576.1 TraR/DksA family transcriptional regulator [Dickeya dadantii]